MPLTRFAWKVHLEMMVSFFFFFVIFYVPDAFFQSDGILSSDNMSDDSIVNPDVDEDHFVYLPSSVIDSDSDTVSQVSDFSPNAESFQVKSEFIFR